MSDAATPHAPIPAPKTSGKCAIEARAAGFQYNPSWWSLRNVSMRLEAGELVALAGPNGAGKSTLLYLMAGQLQPAEGEIVLDGRPVGSFARREFARRVAILPQSVKSAFAYACAEIVAQGRYPHRGALGVTNAEDRAIVERCMRWTHTDAFMRRTIDELSGGERQRVLLASVLAQEAPLILLDEPTSALDINHQIDVFERLAELARRGYGILVVTHDLNLAARYSTRMILLNEGGVAAEGPPAGVMRREILEPVYKTPLIVDRNPVTGAPMVVLLGAMDSRRDREAPE